MNFYKELSKYANRTAVIDDKGCSLTYGQIEAFAKKIGEIIPKRSVVFLYCENQPGSLCSYLSCLYNSVVVLLLSNSIDESLNDELLENYKPSYVFVPEDKKKRRKGYVPVYTEYGYTLLEAEKKKEVEVYEELALLLTTSGSTGSQKLVRQSYGNIEANARSIAQYLELDETERPITTLPMNYTYGLSIINSHILVGATICMTEKSIMQKEFWTFFKEQQVTSFGGVPYTYEMLKKLRFFRMDLPSLRTMTQAGGKLSPKLHQEFAEYAKDKGKQFVVMYGQTEATARMAYLPAGQSLEKCGSMGIPIPGGRFELIDEHGRIIEKPDMVGELVYYGENVTLGYAGKPEDLQLGDLRQGRLETGDMAKKDSDGFYYIVGRKKRFLKIFGNRVNLDECERMLKTKFEENDFACGGQDDRLKIYAVQVDAEEEIISYISGKTGLHPSAFQVVKIENIPKNEAGKVLYAELP